MSKELETILAIPSIGSPPRVPMLWVRKSDYDELAAKLTEAEDKKLTAEREFQILVEHCNELNRLNKVALEAMKYVASEYKSQVLNDAIDELEKP